MILILADTHSSGRSSPRTGQLFLSYYRQRQVVQSFDLSIAQHLVLGDGPGADIQLLESGVSERHCLLQQLTPETCLVIDLKSTNGTFVNGVRIKRSTLVRVGDILRCGIASMQVAAESCRQEAV